MEYQVNAQIVIDALGKKLGQAEVDKAMLEAQVMTMAQEKLNLEKALEESEAKNPTEGGK